MTQLLQTFVDGLTVGSLYALIALGYTMVYGILKFINFAHSDVFALGVHIAITVAVGLGATSAAGPLAWYLGPVVLVAAMAACGALGFVIERAAYRPLRNAPRLNVLITAIGVSLLLQNVGQLPFAFGAYPRSIPNLIADVELFSAAGVSVRLVNVAVFGTALLLMLGLQHLVYSTKLGLAMRAVSSSHRTAALMGINVDLVISITFVIGSMLAAAAGVLYAVHHQSEQARQTADSMWVMLGLKAFVAAVVGGIGNLRGAVLGGILIGLIEFFGAAYVSSAYREAYVFAILIAVLLFKPEGVLGRATVEKV